MSDPIVESKVRSIFIRLRVGLVWKSSKPKKS